MNIVEYNQIPTEVIASTHRSISVFPNTSNNTSTENIDQSVVNGFGDEWTKFNDFQEDDIKVLSNEFYDIVTPDIVHGQSYIIDIGCGSGRFSKYFASKAGFIEAIDPSHAIFAADKLLGNTKNIRLAKASVDNIPFAPETFDFAMSNGVLHHIPDTARAVKDCVKVVKPGGYFYIYLYYKLENRSLLFKSIFNIVSFFRKGVSRLPEGPKKIVCDILAVLIYMPVILLGRFLSLIGLQKAANQLPLNWYQNKSFFVIRTDALDRFGTSLEHRFTKQEIQKMLEDAGLTDIIFSDQQPYWHALAKKPIL
jgi:ubiquinone/menaquinone biosynthesis C-methylase UbiE